MCAHIYPEGSRTYGNHRILAHAFALSLSHTLPLSPFLVPSRVCARSLSLSLPLPLPPGLTLTLAGSVHDPFLAPSLLLSPSPEWFRGGRREP